MFGPERERMCPMCNSFMNAWDRKVADIEQRASLVMIARSPIARIGKLKDERGWKNLRLYSDPSADYTRDYVSRGRVRKGVFRWSGPSTARSHARPFS